MLHDLCLKGKRRLARILSVGLILEQGTQTVEILSAHSVCRGFHAIHTLFQADDEVVGRGGGGEEAERFGVPELVQLCFCGTETCQKQAVELGSSKRRGSKPTLQLVGPFEVAVFECGLI